MFDCGSAGRTDGNGNCIDKGFVNDGKNNCADGSDEGITGMIVSNIFEN